MGLTVVNNVASMIGQNNLNRTSNALSKSLERLSSGLKINRGADGPAALVISEQQRAQISGLSAAIDNTSKAVSMVQTAEGALNEINSLLLKVRGLAIDSSNSGVQDAASLAANQSEVSNALDTITRIASTTQFGQKQLLDGSRAAATSSSLAAASATASGSVASGTYAVTVTTAGTRSNTTAGTIATNWTMDETLTVNGTAIKINNGTTVANAITLINSYSSQTGVKAISDAPGVNAITLYSEAWGAGHQVNVVSNQAAAAGNSGFGNATIVAADGVDMVGSIGGVTVNGVGNTMTASSGNGNGLTVTYAASGAAAATVVTTSSGAGLNANISVDASKALKFQVGANAGQTASILMDGSRAIDLGVGGSGAFANLSAINVTNTNTATDVLKTVDKAIDQITTLRGRLGAFQKNTLESVGNNLRTTMENTTAAESVIRDTDFASETAMFTKNQVLMQAGASVLQNANQTPQLILSLLRG